MPAFAGPSEARRCLFTCAAAFEAAAPALVCVGATARPPGKLGAFETVDERGLVGMGAILIPGFAGLRAGTLGVPGVRFLLQATI